MSPEHQIPPGRPISLEDRYRFDRLFDYAEFLVQSGVMVARLLHQLEGMKSARRGDDPSASPAEESGSHAAGRITAPS